MKLLRGFTIFVFLMLRILSAHAQNVLPDFTVKELTKGKIQISWNNPFTNCIQLSLQRSVDSTGDFRTIFSTQSPELPSNGFVDNRQLPNNKRYYRIFYVLDGGAYFFSKPVVVDVIKSIDVRPITKIDTEKNSKKEKYNSVSTKSNDLIKIYIQKSEVFKLTKSEYKLFRDSINTKTKDGLHKINDLAIEWRPAKANNEKEEITSIYKKNLLLVKLNVNNYKKFKDSIATQTQDTLYTISQWRIQLNPFIPEEKPYLFIYKKDTLVAKLELPLYKIFKDSIATKTKDTLFFIDNTQLEIHPFVPKYVWKPSVYVFTNTKGYVTIMLPLVKQHRYRVIFYDEDASELFQIKSIKEMELVLDKTNFMHAGWFSFELFEDDKLKEKNKFLLSRD